MIPIRVVKHNYLSNRKQSYSDMNEINNTYRDRILSARIELLRTKIRYAEEPNNPALITDWLLLDQCNDNDSVTKQRQHHEEHFCLLLETIADELLPGHWRCTCLDNINRPLIALKKLSDSDKCLLELNELFYELYITSNYVGATLTVSNEMPDHEKLWRSF
jgi:hypothetical protein